MVRKIVILLVAVLLPLSAWALKPVEDSDLSSVSGPNSLDVNPVERARLVLRTRTKDGISGIGLAVLEAMREQGNAVLYGDKDDDDASSGEHFLFALYLGPREYRTIYIRSEDLQSDQAYGKYEIDVGFDSKTGRDYALDAPLMGRYSHHYPSGDYRRSTDPVTWVNRPYGGPEMRSHYLNDATTRIQPNSWVDVKPR